MLADAVLNTASKFNWCEKKVRLLRQTGKRESEYSDLKAFK